MIFDTVDYEFLKLCGISRYIPSGLQKVYDAPFLKRCVIYNLQEHDVIKMQSDNKSFKLTKRGRDILADMGYEFPNDARMDLTRTAYKRKLNNAEINIMLHLANVDIFNSYPTELSDKNGYVSTLIMRSDKNMKVLSCSQFLGILKTGDIVYIPYYIESKASTILPNFEQEIITSQILCFKNIKSVKLLLIGNSLEELWDIISYSGEAPQPGRGRKRIREALEVMGMEYLLIPKNQEGVYELAIINNWRYREIITKSLNCTMLTEPKLSYCDGMIDDSPCIVGVDMNIQRIIKACKQAKGLNMTPTVCCLHLQKPVLDKILKEKITSKVRVAVIGKEGIKKAFPTYKPTRHEYVTKEGDCIEVPAKQRKENEEEYKA